MIEQTGNNSRVITRRGLYRLPLDFDTIHQQLLKAYKVEVAKRNYGQDKTQETPEISAMLNRTAQWLSTPTPKPFLVLMGNVGNGKTTMAKAVATLYSTLSNQASTENKNRGMLSEEERWLWDRLEIAPNWRMNTAQEVVTMSANAVEYPIIKTASNLILDELGVEATSVKVFGTDTTPVIDLLLYRYEQMLPTIITTNLNPKEVEARYGTRIYDRIKEVGEVLCYTGASFR